METRDVVLVDTFTAEPTGGARVVVVPDDGDLADGQLRAVAAELGAPATTVPTDGPPDGLRAVGPDGRADADPRVIVGAFGVATERGWTEPGTHALATGDGREVTVGDDGRTWVGVGDPDPQSAETEHGTLAEALGVDVASLRDVGADLPPFRVSAGLEALAVPVNFLEHLGTATPDRTGLADVADATSVDALCAFTFDTLSPGAGCHARTFVPRSAGPLSRSGGTEIPVAPATAAGVATHLSRTGVVGSDDLWVETGHYLDRPGRVRVDVGGVRVGGRTVTSLDGSLAVPPADDEEILEP